MSEQDEKDKLITRLKHDVETKKSELKQLNERVNKLDKILTDLPLDKLFEGFFERLNKNVTKCNADYIDESVKVLDKLFEEYKSLRDLYDLQDGDED